jgi:hypothetical protein
MKNPFSELDVMNRRAFLCRAGATVGAAALATLMNPHWVFGAAANRAANVRERPDK